jgi:hypothetical protein
MLHPQSIPERLVKLKAEMRELTDFNLRYLLKKKSATTAEEDVYYHRRSRLLEIKEEFEKILQAFRQQQL